MDGLTLWNVGLPVTSMCFQRLENSSDVCFLIASSTDLQLRAIAETFPLSLLLELATSKPFLQYRFSKFNNSGNCLAVVSYKVAGEMRNKILRNESFIDFAKVRAMRKGLESAAGKFSLNTTDWNSQLSRI